MRCELGSSLPSSLVELFKGYRFLQLPVFAGPPPVLGLYQVALSLSCLPPPQLKL